MIGPGSGVPSHIGVAIRLRLPGHVDPPAAWTLKIYGPSIARCRLPNRAADRLGRGRLLDDMIEDRLALRSEDVTAGSAIAREIDIAARVAAGAPSVLETHGRPAAALVNHREEGHGRRRLRRWHTQRGRSFSKPSLTEATSVHC